MIPFSSGIGVIGPMADYNGLHLGASMPPHMHALPTDACDRSPAPNAHEGQTTLGEHVLQKGAATSKTGIFVRKQPLRSIQRRMPCISLLICHDIKHNMPERDRHADMFHSGVLTVLGTAISSGLAHEPAAPKSSTLTFGRHHILDMLWFDRLWVAGELEAPDGNAKKMRRDHLRARLEGQLCGALCQRRWDNASRPAFRQVLLQDMPWHTPPCET